MLTFSLLSLSLFFLSLHSPFHIHKFILNVNEFQQTLFLRFWFRLLFFLRTNYGFVLRRRFRTVEIGEERSDADAVQAHVIGSGGKGVCAVTDKVLWPGEDEGSADGDVEGRRCEWDTVFSWWWCKRSGS